MLYVFQTLSHCEQITDDGIYHLSDNLASYDRLSVLELDNCPAITDAALEHLRRFNALQRLELYDCQLVTKYGIRRLKVP